MCPVAPDEMRPGEPRALSRSECLALLRAQGNGRIAYTSEGVLTVVPAAFELTRGKIQFQARNLRRLSEALGQVATVQSDGYDEHSGEHWSVCATGFVVSEGAGDLELEPELFQGFADLDGDRAARPS